MPVTVAQNPSAKLTKKLKAGAKCWYRNSLFGTVEAVVEEYERDIKNGRPGYAVRLVTPNHGETDFWGYVDQVTPR